MLEAASADRSRRLFTSWAAWCAFLQHRRRDRAAWCKALLFNARQRGRRALHLWREALRGSAGPRRVQQARAGSQPQHNPAVALKPQNQAVAPCATIAVLAKLRRLQQEAADSLSRGAALLAGSARDAATPAALGAAAAMQPGLWQVASIGSLPCTPQGCWQDGCVSRQKVLGLQAPASE
jgi:hypothetical protein